MNSSVWAVWAAQGSKGKKVDLSFSEQLLRVVSPTFCGQKKILKFFLKFFSNRTKKLHKKLLLKKKCLFFCPKQVEKIGCNSRLILSVIQRGAVSTHCI